MKSNSLDQALEDLSPQKPTATFHLELSESFFEDEQTELLSFVLTKASQSISSAMEGIHPTTEVLIG